MTLPLGTATVLLLIIAFLGKATPIYLLVLRAQEVGNEPFWNLKKKLKNVTFFIYFIFFRV